MAKRAAKLTYNGSMVPSVVADDGTVMQSAPNYSISGVPARDLTEAEVKALDDETYKLAIDAKMPGGKSLYTGDSGGSDDDEKSAGSKEPASSKRGS